MCKVEGINWLKQKFKGCNYHYLRVQGASKHFSQKIVNLKYIKLIKNIYYRALISARTSGGITNKFLITIGLHQGSTLSPYLFVLVIDELTKLILRGSLLVYAFVDNIVLVNETSSGVNLKLKIWRDTLESKSFH